MATRIARLLIGAGLVGVAVMVIVLLVETLRTREVLWRRAAPRILFVWCALGAAFGLSFAIRTAESYARATPAIAFLLSAIGVVGLGFDSYFSHLLLTDARCSAMGGLSVGAQDGVGGRDHGGAELRRAERLGLGT